MTNTKARRLGFLLPHLGDGGAQRAAVSLLTHLNRTRYQPMLFLFRRTGPHLADVPSDVPVVELGGHEQNVWTKAQLLNKALVRTQPNLMVSFLNQANVPAVIAHRRHHHDIRLILCVQNDLTHKFANRSWARRWGKSQLVRWGYPWADHVIAVSQGVRLDLANEFGLRPQKVTVIHNPIDVDRIRRAIAQVPPGWSSDPPEKLVVAAGRLVPQKGFDILLRAFSEVCRHIDARLILLGDGPQRDHLQQLATGLGIASSVSMPGFVENPWIHMAQANVFVLSSHWEGMPLVVGEAMACGAAVIATDCDHGPREYITPNVNGILVPVADSGEMSRSIVRLLKDETEAARLGENAWARAHDFDSRKICREYEALFDSVLEKQTGSQQSFLSTVTQSG